jgi:cytochrome c biogenesis protein CcmG/thiol:disulfide interchange protein DsbE
MGNSDLVSTTDASEQGEGKRGVRWGVIAAWVLVLGLLAVLGVGLIRTNEGPITVGSEVPDITLTTFEGDQIALSDLEGQVVVLNFWASWCKPCEQEANELEKAHQLYQDQGVVFLGVDYVDTEPEALAYLEKFNISYPNGPDLGTRISQAFRIRGVPETYLIGRDGRLAAVKIGPYTSFEELQLQVESVLAEESSG